MKKKSVPGKILISVLCFFAAGFAGAQDLSVLPEDVRIIQSPEGGYRLFIRKKPDIASVLITETTRDPAMQADNYTYRTERFNTVNGNERRILDGRFLDENPENEGLYFLTDSTPSADPEFGEAFQIWIPYILQYGFPGTRHGEVQVLNGTFLNIRAFAKPYADYSGAFQDNPYRLKVTQRPVEREPEEDLSIYMSDTVRTFSDLASASGGSVRYAAGPEEIVPAVREILSNEPPEGLDVVFALDATESMKNDIREIRKSIPPLLEEILPADKPWRVALVLYKDYFEDFTVKTACGFTGDMQTFSRALKNFAVQGGRDIPEAVYEAVDCALDLPWNENADRVVILIGDAPAHPRPRGKVTRESVEAKAAARNVRVEAIILPHGETY